MSEAVGGLLIAVLLLGLGYAIWADITTVTSPGECATMLDLSDTMADSAMVLREHGCEWPRLDTIQHTPPDSAVPEPTEPT